MPDTRKLRFGIAGMTGDHVWGMGDGLAAVPGCSRYFCEWLFHKERNGGRTFIDEACYLVDAFVDYHRFPRFPRFPCNRAARAMQEPGDTGGGAAADHER